MTFDLLIKGGHVLDPGQGLDGPMDIAISAGRIDETGPDLDSGQARRTIQVTDSNRRVVPGLFPKGERRLGLRTRQL